MMRQGSRLAQDFLQTAWTKFAVMAFGLGIGIVTARCLGPHDRGLYSLLITLPTTLVILVKLGQSQANVYFLRRHQVPPRAILLNSLILTGLLGGGCVALALLLRSALLGTILKGATGVLFLVLLPILPIQLLDSYLSGFLQGQGYFTFFNRRRLAQAVVTLLGMLVALWGFGQGLLAALLIFAGVQAVITLWTLVIAFHVAPPGGATFDLRLLSDMVRFGIKSHLQVVVAYLHFRIDLYMVAFWLSPTDVAFYAIATRIAELLFKIPESLGLALYPRLAAEDARKAQDMTARACRGVFTAVVLGAVVLGVGGPWLVRLWYGQAYSGASAPLPWLLVGVSYMSLYNLISRNFTSQNRQQVNIVAAAISMLVNVGLNLLLIPRLGIVGAAIATAVSYGLAAAIVSVKFIVESQLRWRDVLVPRLSEISHYLTMMPMVRRFRVKPGTSQAVPKL
jgi:O-antigen/teichoic acid export membrane protein